MTIETEEVKAAQQWFAERAGPKPWPKEALLILSLANEGIIARKLIDDGGLPTEQYKRELRAVEAMADDQDTLHDYCNAVATTNGHRNTKETSQ
jgi:hypothetical protein